YCVHDASPEGLALAGRLAEPFGGVRVGAPGLRPALATTMHLGARRSANRGPGPPPPRMCPCECRRRAPRRGAELAAGPPPRRLRAVHGLMHDQQHREPRRWPRRSALRTAGFMSWPTESV